MWITLKIKRKDWSLMCIKLPTAGRFYASLDELRRKGINIFLKLDLFTDTKTAKNPTQKIIRGKFTGDFT